MSLCGHTRTTPPKPHTLCTPPRSCCLRSSRRSSWSCRAASAPARPPNRCVPTRATTAFVCRGVARECATARRRLTLLSSRVVFVRRLGALPPPPPLSLFGQKFSLETAVVAVRGGPHQEIEGAPVPVYGPRSPPSPRAPREAALSEADRRDQASLRLLTASRVVGESSCPAPRRRAASRRASSRRVASAPRAASSRCATSAWCAASRRASSRCAASARRLWSARVDRPSLSFLSHTRCPSRFPSHSVLARSRGFHFPSHAPLARPAAFDFPLSTRAVPRRLMISAGGSAASGFDLACVRSTRRGGTLLGNAPSGRSAIASVIGQKVRAVFGMRDRSHRLFPLRGHGSNLARTIPVLAWCHPKRSDPLGLGARTRDL